LKDVQKSDDVSLNARFCRLRESRYAVRMTAVSRERTRAKWGQL
jgi:hypothetical protein